MTHPTTTTRSSPDKKASSFNIWTGIPLLSLLQYLLGVRLDSPILIKASRARLWKTKTKWWHRVAGVLLVLGLLALLIESMSASVSGGSSAVLGLLGWEGILCAALIPLFAGAAIAEEHEKQTLEPLFITPLSSTRIALGKLLAALCPAIFVQALFLPVFVIAVVLGGISLPALVASQAILLALLLSLGAISLFLSSLCRKTTTGVIVAAIVCVFWVTPAATILSSQMGLLLILLLLAAIVTWFPRMITDLLMQSAWPTWSRAYFYRIRLVLTMLVLLLAITSLPFLLRVPPWTDDFPSLWNPIDGIHNLFPEYAESLHTYYYSSPYTDYPWLAYAFLPAALFVQLVAAYVFFRLTVLRLDSLRNGPREPDLPPGGR